MKFKQLSEKYKNQWVAAEVKSVDQKTNEPNDVEVIAHGRSKDKVYAELQKSDVKKSAVLYTGRPLKPGRVYIL